MTDQPTATKPDDHDSAAEFIAIVASFADTLVTMDLTTPAARATLAELAQSPGFSRLAAAAAEAWGEQKGLLAPVPDHPQALRAIRDLRRLTAHLERLLSYSKELPLVQEYLAALWPDPTFAAVCRASKEAYLRANDPDRII